MKPPIKVKASTDNQTRVTLTFEGAGSDKPMQVHIAYQHGNAYSAISAMAPLVEGAIEQILASHGIGPAKAKKAHPAKAPPPPPPPAAPKPKKKARAKK